MSVSNLDLQKLGGWAAIFNGVAYLIGFAGFLTLLSGLPKSAIGQIEFLLERQYWLHVWYAIIYVLFGLLMSFILFQLAVKRVSNAS